ncbi:MAG: hypothetical protein FWE39_03280 [Nocardiaceae bacterium]|nr:hypothetical protein [Nocardiaceae bacterium]
MALVAELGLAAGTLDGHAAVTAALVRARAELEAAEAALDDAMLALPGTGEVFARTNTSRLPTPRHRDEFTAAEFIAYVDPRREVVWDDDVDTVAAARTVVRIRVIEEATGEEVGTAVHSDILGWNPEVNDAALEAAGWRRAGEWKSQLSCRVERILKAGTSGPDSDTDDPESI